MNAVTNISSAFQDAPSAFRRSSKVPPAPTSLASITHPTSRWAAELSSRFDELTSLPSGWDGYGGQPVSFTCAQFAANLIESLYIEGVIAPQLVPGSDGTVQIEWHRNQFDIEIDVLGAYDVVAIRRHVQTGLIEELELQNDFSALNEWIAGLRQAQIVQLRRA